MIGQSHKSFPQFTANNSTIYSVVNTFLNIDESTHTGYPKVNLNWIFLDDQLNYVSSLSGAVQAASTTYPSGTLNAVAPGSALTMTKSGYLYIWVSNETQGWDVFFDNLSVQYRQGPMLEENHYYPFGLTMQGISDKALKTNYAENKYRYNQGTELQNKEFSDGTGLELYETSFRSFEPQLGRFGQIDPLADRSNYMSAYQYAGNNPINANDPTGLKACPPGMSPAQLAAWAHTIIKGFDSGWDGNQAGDGNDNGGGGGGEPGQIAAQDYTNFWNQYLNGDTYNFDAPTAYIYNDGSNDLTGKQTGINIYSMDLWGNSNLEYSIKTSLATANICIPTLLPTFDKPQVFDLDQAMGSFITDAANFVIDKSKPDALIIDFSGGIIAGSTSGYGGVEAVIFPKGDYNNNSVYGFSYSASNNQGLMLGGGIQVGLGWLNYSNVSGQNGPSPTNYASGTTSFATYGIGAAAYTTSQSYNNGMQLWYTVTAGLSYDGGMDLKGGSASGNLNMTSNGPILPCH